MDSIYGYKNSRAILIFAAAAALLCVPFVAMFFTDEVRWSALDFAVASVLLFGAGIAIEIALRMVTEFRWRIVACGAILFALFLIWAELAVGIFGTPFAGS